MKQCSLFCVGGWPFIALPLLLLLPLLFFEWHEIETKIASNAKANLVANDLAWADVETFNLGRDVLIMGMAPSENAIQQAIQVVSKSDGVRSARFHQGKDRLAPPQTPSLNAIVTGDSIVLRGEVKDQNSIDTLIANASEVFGPENVINKLSIGENTSALPNINGLFSALNGEGRLGTVSASIKDNSVTLRGEILTPQLSDALETALNDLFPGSVSNKFKIAPPPQIKQETCQDLVDQLLVSSEISFESAKDTIKESSFALLENIAGTAKRCPNSNFEVAGHTDSTGNLAFNMRLSEKRAQAVINHLVDLGLNPERFTAVGYGPKQAIGDNETEQGRAKNRRIEFRLNN